MLTHSDLRALSKALRYDVFWMMLATYPAPQDNFTEYFKLEEVVTQCYYLSVAKLYWYVVAIVGDPERFKFWSDGSVFWVSIRRQGEHDTDNDDHDNDANVRQLLPNPHAELPDVIMLPPSQVHPLALPAPQGVHPVYVSNSEDDITNAKKTSQKKRGRKQTVVDGIKKKRTMTKKKNDDEDEDPRPKKYKFLRLPVRPRQ